jgi:hypothetical protein
VIYLGPDPIVRPNPLAALDADSRVTVSASASWLDAESRGDQ